MNLMRLCARIKKRTLLIITSTRSRPSGLHSGRLLLTMRQKTVPRLEKSTLPFALLPVAHRCELLHGNGLSQIARFVDISAFLQSNVV
jgi:hypothetical protein